MLIGMGLIILRCGLGVRGACFGSRQPASWQAVRDGLPSLARPHPTNTAAAASQTLRPPCLRACLPACLLQPVRAGSADHL